MSEYKQVLTRYKLYIDVIYESVGSIKEYERPWRNLKKQCESHVLNCVNGYIQVQYRNIA